MVERHYLTLLAMVRITFTQEEGEISSWEIMSPLNVFFYNDTATRGGPDGFFSLLSLSSPLKSDDEKY